MFRFATFAAVSSDPQAREDKASLGDQVETARAAGLAQGGLETAGPFILDGYSRTGYVNLSDALRDIPELASAIQAAEQNLYDVLIMDNVERMGDLAPMLSTLFKRYRKQLHSARQSGRVFDPSTYDPTNDESGDIMIHVEGIIQKYRLNKLRRGWNIGVPRRIDLGLVPFRVPYGYDRTGKTTPPVQNENAKYVIMIKDWVLEGRALKWITEELERRGVPTPSGRSDRWHVETVRHIALNPVYAGIVAIGQKRSDHRSKKGKLYRGRTPQGEWKQGRGGHAPLWDEATLLDIQNEFARRMGLKNYAKFVYPLAGLLRCTECKQKLNRRNVSRNGQLMPGLGCKGGNTHISITYSEAVQLLGRTLKEGLHETQSNPPKPEEEAARLRSKLDDLKEQRLAVQEGYKLKIYSGEEAAGQIAVLERQEKTTRAQLDNLEHTQQNKLQARTLVHELSQMDDLAEWIMSDDPAIVNRLLSALCQVVWVAPSHEMTIEWRE
jgi:site-specific DNA recombinase